MTEGKKTGAEFVVKWLESSGTALELRTAQTFLRSTRFVEHSHHYTVAEGTREIDVVARYIRDAPTKDSIAFQVVLVTECKSLSDPWVLYPRDRHVLTGDETLFGLYVTKQSKPFGKIIMPSGYHKAPLFKAQWTHYAISDTGSKRETSYGALNQAWSAVAGINASTRVDQTQSSITVYVPIVVTTAPLFTVELLRDGQPEIKEIDRALIVTSMNSKRDRRPVWVLNESALKDFAADAKRSLDAMRFKLANEERIP